LYLYNSEYKKYSPSTNYIDFKYSKDLIGLGIKFFIIQIALVVIMSTDNIIISQLYSPKLVTPYQIARKYFYIPLSIFSIIVSPFWSATTEAYKKSDYKWIKNMVKKLNKIVIIFVLIGILMLIFSKKIYIIWLGENINISYLLSGSWLLFFIIGIINGIYSNIINGFGKIKVQTYIYFLGMIINIPLSIFFAKKLNLGIEGVILATVICQSLHFIILPIQYKKLITKNAKGIWNK
jgi:O-antigen/teichoic acid export membrane protein